ncbi:50S ribosomal protein L23 [Porphyromonas levii]|uniref:Large ribosomal subunit protein uL23 n=1 Tax=Porphyromonas levii TaxID=28114 RepID=A0A4Y8WT66_9PORP|nr:50S ribosomal protein L23 [Porphyromonas levii]MBR8713753.1 50S ribosomal protein L23 [Porphyromonas levii]MBR8715766.1 50S ribosomal protein L23 [Porphyromonas levii]MBR8728314.1 50S ribosomal protein L23 [Porphyromonas levii]MBR8729364.1 50S ribosomal protein L23 [Porphyromonas levii]MBR8731020.1 50S ribosomal protein L23 [Porphyromonas levii]
MRGILIQPIITEKQNDITEAMSNRYGFKVVRNANKSQIKEAVEKMYDVNVVSVNTANYDGKRKSRFTKGGLIQGRTPAFKKAIVTLKEGQVIDFFSNI